MDKQDFKKRMFIEDIHKHLGQEVIIAGWLYNKRSSGKIHFLLVRDGTNVIQCVMVKGEVPEELFASYESWVLSLHCWSKGRCQKINGHLLDLNYK